MKTVTILFLIGLLYTEVFGDISGSGTAADPYRLSTYTDLSFLKRYPSACFILTCDIDASSSAFENPGDHDNVKSTDNDVFMGWVPLPAFSGVLDGKGYAINSLTCNRPRHDEIAFIKVMEGGQIKNLQLKRCIIRGQEYVGGIVSWCRSNAIIENCLVTGSIQATNRTGGIAARGSYSQIVNCSFMGNIQGNTLTGGLIGLAENMSVEDCWSIAVLSGRTGIGGLIGGGDSISVLHCFSRCSIKGTGNLGGIAGGLNSRSTIQECFSACSLQGTTNVGGITGMLADTSMIANSYSMCFIRCENGAGGLVGQWSDSVCIRNCYAVGTVRASVYEGGLVGALFLSPVSIVSSYFDKDKSFIDSSIWGESKSTLEMMQQETFDGWNFSTVWEIREGETYPALRNVKDTSSLDISRTHAYCFVGSGTKEDPYLIRTYEDLKMIGSGEGEYYSLVADIDAKLSGFENSGDHDNNPNTSDEYMGWQPKHLRGVLNGNGHIIRNITINRPKSNPVGLFGYMMGAVVSCLKLESFKINGSSQIGSLAGDCRNSKISEVFSSGSFVAYNTESGKIGGLLGSCYGCKIERCLAGGFLTGARYVGGLIGNSDSSVITNSQAGADINGPGNYLKCVGGLLGYCEKSTVLNCFSNSGVNTRDIDHSGGLIGFCDSSSIDAGFYIESNGFDSSAGGSGLSIEAAKRRSSFTGWDFETIWTIDENVSLPQLKFSCADASPIISGRKVPVCCCEIQKVNVSGAMLFIHGYSGEGGNIVDMRGRIIRRFSGDRVTISDLAHGVYLVIVEITGKQRIASTFLVR